jgi:TnpA family transposase
VAQSYVDDEPYRREIKAMRNLHEGRHDLARTTFHGRTGELQIGDEIALSATDFERLADAFFDELRSKFA